MEETLIYKIEILKMIECKYNIEIKDEEIENILSFENLINLIKEKLSQKNTILAHGAQAISTLEA